MKILIVEDHKHKIEELKQFIDENFEDMDYEIKTSYHSGLKEVILNHKSYDLILLDMSMYNYDIAKNETGGDPIPLAGQLILHQMYNKGIETKVIVVTMFETFAGKKLEDLDSSLSRDFKDIYIGYVYFTASEGKWKNDLKKLIIDNFLK
ncbi:hypothetical protein [Ulvibacterium marinum]|uniref:hypothetical protein n=1 Tax=Ulvibacterium marinum TaxID=2419782 RepID=UPI0024949C16|nr:hypothetical protein [Ulvibacterium marinum]